MEANQPDFTAYEVFASYSRVDTPVVKPLVELMRAIGPSVFRDEDSIPPGHKWSVVLADAIEGCRVVLVFWCAHSADSKEVKKEYMQAIDLEKTVIPVLLDETPLYGRLAEFQGVDMRGFNAHDLAPPPVPATPASKTSGIGNWLRRPVHAVIEWLGARFASSVGDKVLGDIHVDVREDIVTAYNETHPDAERYADVALHLYSEIGRRLQH